MLIEGHLANPLRANWRLNRHLGDAPLIGHCAATALDARDADSGTGFVQNCRIREFYREWAG